MDDWVDPRQPYRGRKSLYREQYNALGKRNLAAIERIVTSKYQRGPAFNRQYPFVRSAVLTFQSTETTTTEKALIRRVLLDICSVPLFGRVSMMFMLHQFLVPRYFPLTLSASLTAIGWRHRRHMARHNINPHVACLLHWNRAF
jgi:hypothetical protein